MAFVNGFPTEEDLKINLYLNEPEQISDLVYVPLAVTIGRYLSRISQIQEEPNYYNEEGNRFINFPFNHFHPSTGSSITAKGVPLLFQRFNPYNKPFADEYSKKIFDFLYQFIKYFTHYSAWGINDKFARFVGNTDYPLQTEIPSLYLPDYVFNELIINLPNNGLRIEFSYYYPDYIPEDDWFYREPSNNILESIKKRRQVIYPQIDNECIETPYARAWLINFNFTGVGQTTTTIRQDILIGSLVITFIDENNWTESDKNYILNQIPDYYFYDNLDDFFNLITNDITTKQPNILKESEFAQEALTNFTFRLNGNTIIEREYRNYQQTTIDIYPKVLIYANNNNWNNTYSWVDNDKGTIYQDINHLVAPQKLNNKTPIEWIFQEFSSNVGQDEFIYTCPLFYYYRGSESLRVSTFFNSGIINDGIFNRFELTRRRSRIIQSQAPIARILLDSIDNLFTVGNVQGKYATRSSTTQEYVYERHIFSFNIYLYSYDYLIENSSYSTNSDEIEQTGSIISPLDNISWSTYETSFTIKYNHANTVKATRFDESEEERFNYIFQAHEECYKVANCDLEDLKKDVKEIHAALDAGKFAYLDGSTEQQR